MRASATKALADLRAPPARTLCVVLHDVADATLAACDAAAAAVAEVAPVPLSLLVVPRYHGAPPTRALVHWLAQRRDREAAEVVLHGYTHLDEGSPTGPADRLRRRVYTRGEGEFWALPEAEAARRLAAGADWLDAEGLGACGFVAPAWLLGAAARRALVGCGRFGYTATLGGVEALPGGPAVASWAIVYSHSTRWRRALSVAFAAANSRRLEPRPLLRLELHPADALDRGLRRSFQRVLERALATRDALTLGDYVRTRLPADAATARRPQGVGR